MKLTFEVIGLGSYEAFEQKDLPGLIGKVRSDLGLSMSQFGALVDVTRQGVSAWERGCNPPSVKMIFDLFSKIEHFSMTQMDFPTYEREYLTPSFSADVEEGNTEVGGFRAVDMGVLVAK